MDQATKIYKNGTIITLNETDLVTDALAICGTNILATGAWTELSKLASEGTEIIDLAGKTILPGFYDSHGHINMAGEYALFRANLNSPPIGAQKTIDDCLQELKMMAGKQESGGIYGFGYDDTMIEEKRHLTRHDLDQVSTERPVIVSHISGHLTYLNSKALEMVGYDEHTIDPIGGVIQREADSNQPNGVLEETAGRQPLIRGNGMLSDEQRIASLVYISEQYAKEGVTTGSYGLMYDRKQLELLKEAEEQLKIRVVVNPKLDHYDEICNGFSSTDKVILAGGKEIQDGSLQGYTGYLSKPYYCSGTFDPAYRGYPTNEKAAFVAEIVKAYQEEHQPVVHCNGDAALDDYLDALETAQNLYPEKALRPVVIHCQTAREDQLDKIKALGAVPSFFVLHTYYWGDRHWNIFLGPERAARLDPVRSALERGIVCSTHCDTPITPQKPLLSIWAAVNRLSSTGNVIGAEQTISVMEALKTYTIYAAYQNFEEKARGSLEPGKYADLVILSENILECEKEKIRDIEVLETILAGQTVYKKQSL